MQALSGKTGENASPNFGKCSIFGDFTVQDVAKDAGPRPQFLQGSIRDAFGCGIEPVVT